MKRLIFPEAQVISNSQVQQRRGAGVLLEFICQYQFRTLNEAGPRGLSDPEIGELVKQTLVAAHRNG